MKHLVISYGKIEGYIVVFITAPKEEDAARSQKNLLEQNLPPV